MMRLGQGDFHARSAGQIRDDLIEATSVDSRNGAAWRALIGKLDAEGLSLQAQLRRALVAAIDGGKLPAGTRLPALRVFAAHLGVSRNTVLGAVRGLEVSGHLESRARSGVYVTGAMRPGPRPRALGSAQTGWRYPPALRPSFFGLTERLPGTGEFPFPLIPGSVDADLFPTAGWRESVRAAGSVGETRRWTGDRIDEDDPELCRQLCTTVLPARGIWAAQEELVLTTGAQQGLFLIAQLFLSGGRTGGIENPGYPDLRGMLRLFTPSVVQVPVDGQGAVPGPDLLRCDVVFLSNAVQCPTTVALAPDRQRRFLDAAARSGMVIVDDDHSVDLADPDMPPALKAMDRTGNVIHVGSLSMMLAPGLRIGFVVAPAEIAIELRTLRRLMMRHPPANNQRALALFLSLGHYRAHLAHLRSAMAERHARVAAALAAHLPEVAWQRGPASRSYWLTLPEPADGRALAEAARRVGVLIEPGDVYFADPADGRRHVRLSLGAIRAGRIEEAIRRLGAVLARMDHEAGL